MQNIEIIIIDMIHRLSVCHALVLYQNDKNLSLVDSMNWSQNSF